ncbi:ABC transporter substrate-binding protein [Angustibacter luteus]|uniref:ABC transporter substrate-binding protein n=1 Tax=Angustibacter luteus TaxID=658456 RepID=A0ABW1JJF5_9ACTN
MRNHASRRVLAVASATLLLSAVACSRGGTGSGGGADDAARADVPGVTDTQILLGTHMPLTGPASGGYSKIAPATKAYFDFVNAAGGVNGRKITYKYLDDGYNPANTQKVVRQLVLQDKVFSVLNGLGTPTHTSVLDFLGSNKVPDLFVASGATAWNQPQKYPNTFGFNTDYTVEGKILATYVKASLPGKKVCSLGQSDDFGADFVKGVETVLGASGLAAKQSYTVTNQNVAPQVGALKAAGCQVVMLATVPGFTALTVGTAAKLAFQPQWVVSNVGGDYKTVAAALGKAAPLLEGMVGLNYLPMYNDTANPWIQLFTKVNDQNNGKADFDGNVVYGMSVGYLAVQSLQNAGKDLTRDGVVQAVEKNGFVGPGLVPLRFSATDHSGYAGGRLTKVAGGVQAYFGPSYVTDDGSGAVTESSQAPATPPASGIPAS